MAIAASLTGVGQAEHVGALLREERYLARFGGGRHGEQHIGIVHPSPPQHKHPVANFHPLLESLLQRGLDEGRRRDGRRAEDGAVLQQARDLGAQVGIEDPDHDPQTRVQLVGGERGVDVPHVVAAGDIDLPCAAHPRPPEAYHPPVIGVDGVWRPIAWTRPWNCPWAVGVTITTVS